MLTTLLALLLTSATGTQAVTRGDGAAPSGQLAGSPSWSGSGGEPASVMAEVLGSHVPRLFAAGFVLLHGETGEAWRRDATRCAARLPPCSTFKIANALIGLETGVVPEAGHVIAWDGREHRREVLNRDHDLRSAVADSVVWYFQEAAARVGAERMQAHLSGLQYGNADISGGLTTFWLGSSLRISADEQVAFLRRLAAGDLPLSERSQEIVRDLLVLSRSDGAVLHGKTGSCHLEKGSLGWFVGWVRGPRGTWFFACNVEGDGAWGGTAREASETILRRLGLLGPAP